MTPLGSLRSPGETSPPPLNGREWWILAAATVLGAVSRLVTLARTPWDWDEFLFMLAVDRFDVARHHPHPPGFPLFILGAKIVRKLGFDNFHALQAMNVLAAIAIVPVMFFLCRELRMRFGTSLSAALLLAFFPNVWFFGGTAFSDVPSMTLVVLAVALLFAGCRNTYAFLAGAALLAVAGGFRLQSLLIGLVPLLIASAFQVRRGVGRVVAAVVVVVVTIGVSYGTAAWLTGWKSYAEASQMHGRFIVRTDSFRAPQRPPLPLVFEEFFVRPYQAPLINTMVTVFAVISSAVSVVRRRLHVLLVMATFAPFCVFAWLMLDRLSAGRFSIGYAPLIALLTADGVRLVMRTKVAEALGEVVIVVLMIVWAWPALMDLHRTVSPPVAAAEWILDHADARTSVIYVDESMGPAAEWYLPRYRLLSMAAMDQPSSPPGYQLREGRIGGSGVVTFAHARDRLWKIVRRRYFEASVVVPAPPTS